ncbi:MAG TPA: hypothetical protein VGT61_12775 [Thermomicrobiales bacterium]|nr:hypothetical protein [Thermomicrobiales bacterium]
MPTPSPQSPPARIQSRVEQSESSPATDRFVTGLTVLLLVIPSLVFGVVAWSTLDTDPSGGGQVDVPPIGTMRASPWLPPALAIMLLVLATLPVLRGPRRAGALTALPSRGWLVLLAGLIAGAAITPSLVDPAPVGGEVGAPDPILFIAVLAAATALGTAGFGVGWFARGSGRDTTIIAAFGLLLVGVFAVGLYSLLLFRLVVDQDDAVALRDTAATLLFNVPALFLWTIPIVGVVAGAERRAGR